MVGAILQARMSSSRFPGKVLMPLPWGGGVSILGRIHEQIKRSQKISKFIIATSTDASDDVIAAEVQKLGIEIYRGDLNDVYQRFYDVTLKEKFVQAVRLTGDNPLVDIGLLDQFIADHIKNDRDYTISEGLPLGCNFEMYKAASFLSLKSKSLSAEHHEHVTLYFRHHMEDFKASVHRFVMPEGVSELRLTVDYPSDYALWNILFQMKCEMNVAAIAKTMAQNPWLRQINQGNKQFIF